MKDEYEFKEHNCRNMLCSWLHDAIYSIPDTTRTVSDVVGGWRSGQDREVIPNETYSPQALISFCKRNSIDTNNETMKRLIDEARARSTNDVIS